MQFEHLDWYDLSLFHLYSICTVYIFLQCFHSTGYLYSVMIIGSIFILYIRLRHNVSLGQGTDYIFEVDIVYNAEM